MLVYKNFDIVPGISINLEFPMVDDTFLKMDLTGYSFKLELFNKDLTLKFVAIDGFVTSLGMVTKTLSDSETLTFSQGLLQYRLVIKSGAGVSVLSYKGFFNCAEPSYSEISNPANSTIVLPDGSIYMSQPGPIILGLWYSISNHQRIIVSGVGRVGMDLRNNVGAVRVSNEFFTTTIDEDTEWIPYVEYSTSFRINQIYGANTVKYLP